MSSPTRDEEDLPEGLYWLVDTPLFIDENRIDRYHDIVVNPLTESVYQEVKTGREESESSESTAGAEGNATAEGKGKLGKGLLEMLASGELRGSLSIGGYYERTRAEGKTEHFALTPTAPRQLAEITIYYDEFEKDRIFINQSPTDEAWRNEDSISETPRQLVYLELPSDQEAASNDNIVETKLVPVAAEFEDGAVVPVYETLIEKIHDRIIDKASKGEREDITAIMSYPERSDYDDVDALEEHRHRYWDQFREHFRPKQAMEVVEEAAREHGRIDWIAFRLPLGTEGKTLHLHIEPNGKYSNGTFAYNFIKRGQKHGLRLVGTMKSEPDMNVLAIYER